MSDGRYGLGQIVAAYGSSGGHFYFVVFRSTYSGDQDPPLARVVQDDLALLALSMDALLYHGHWQVVGRHAVQADRVPWPEYKEGAAPGVFDVVDASGRTRRPATTDEIERLPFRKVVAPIIVQDAFEALHGAREWLPEYDHLKV